MFQQRGLQELQHGSDQFFSLRGPLCSIILIAYHTVVSYVLGEYFLWILDANIFVYLCYFLKIAGVSIISFLQFAVSCFFLH